MYIELCMCVKYPLFCETIIKHEFTGQILEKNSQISNFTKICALGIEIFHADRQTDG